MSFGVVSFGKVRQLGFGNVRYVRVRSCGVWLCKAVEVWLFVVG